MSLSLVGPGGASPAPGTEHQPAGIGFLSRVSLTQYVLDEVRGDDELASDVFRYVLVLCESGMEFYEALRRGLRLIERDPVRPKN